MESDLYREKICAKININILNFAYFLDIFNIREKMANVRKKEYMQEKNLRLKRQLILQSFTPLFALVLIKYFDWNIIPCIIFFLGNYSMEIFTFLLDYGKILFWVHF